MVERTSVVSGVGTAFPYDTRQQDLWDGFFSGHYNGSPIARRLFKSSGVTTRHSVANPVIEDLSDWSTAKRMQRYSTEAFPLACSATERALENASADASDVGTFIVVSCTGYATPGLDTRVAQALGMAPNVHRLFVGHTGCHAALPAISTASNSVLATGRPAVVVCVELASLHIQPADNDVEQMVAHSLFSDAASAAVVQAADDATTGGLELVDVEVLTDHETASLMTWDVTDKGFRMKLSQQVPDALALHVRHVIDRLLERNELSISDIESWLAHPGGPRILDVIEEQLQLGPDALDVSRSVLSEHGNCSSATVLVVMQEMLRQRPIAPGGYLVALAFGPGLTLYSMLFKQS